MFLVCVTICLFVCIMILRWGSPRLRIAPVIIIVSGCIWRFLVLCWILWCFWLESYPRLLRIQDKDISLVSRPFCMPQTFLRMVLLTVRWSLPVLTKGSGQRFSKNCGTFLQGVVVVHNRMNADLHIFPFDCSIASSLKSPKRLDCLNHWDREAVWYKFDEWKILNN